MMMNSRSKTKQAYSKGSGTHSIEAEITTTRTMSINSIVEIEKSLKYYIICCDY
jgi:hypothetical protein